MIKWVYNVVQSSMQEELLTIENTLPCTHATPRIGPAALRPGSGHTASQLEPGLLRGWQPLQPSQPAREAQVLGITGRQPLGELLQSNRSVCDHGHEPPCQRLCRAIQQIATRPTIALSPPLLRPKPRRNLHAGQSPERSHCQ